jgi:hypothetical protein
VQKCKKVIANLILFKNIVLLDRLTKPNAVALQYKKAFETSRKYFIVHPISSHNRLY